MLSQNLFETAKKNPENPGVLDVDPQELWSKREAVKIVDVRQPEEFTGELGHVPGAELVVLNTLPGELGEWNPSETIVFVCRSGARSGRAAAFAQAQGFENVYNMRGGMLLWNELKLDTEREA